MTDERNDPLAHKALQPAAALMAEWQKAFQPSINREQIRIARSAKANTAPLLRAAGSSTSRAKNQKKLISVEGAHAFCLSIFG